MRVPRLKPSGEPLTLPGELPTVNLEEELMDGKSPLFSKSNWAGLLMCAAPFIPGAQPWIVANPELYSVGVGLIVIALRAVTGRPIDWTTLKP